ncbi:MAG TPA: hypothetical protein VEK07_25660 [Polyangiaceae bacterium]|nr:hypothetical protein [Polyangiaceae bacterium]
MRLLRRGGEFSRSWSSPATALALALALVLAPSGARADDTAAPTASTAGRAPPSPPPLPPPPPPPASYASPAPDVPPPPPPGASRPLIVSDWPEDEPAPAGYHWGKRVRRGPIIAGAVLFGTFYLISAFVGAAGQTVGDRAYGWLYLPALGPFVEITNSSSALGTVTLIMDGAVQSGALALLVWGITSPAPVLVRNQIDAPRVMPVPMILGRNGSGMGLVGTF